MFFFAKSSTLQPSVDLSPHPGDGPVNIIHRGMGTISALMAFCERNPPVTDGFPSERASYVELWCQDAHATSL